ncbi:long-chain-fatty-acid--CoA ligase [Phenylobacterium sp.]|uniref:long-chain-fatty-acid--CoA ligase n=1 Tax=Phenylobacterium sp. TaxID=1871053 RepID=UPI002715D794|nr:long-chain-fatty-acid--CoA ligase [Phenylobacterium sp.]MDO8801314.1 long-chain-fatty-acid--CoA ligase [Phenylobacterium sp.]
MQGRMQDWPLTVDRILDHAKSWHGDREIVSRSVEGPMVRTTYAQVHARAKRVSNVLRGLNIQPGDRVATLAWNTARHIEAWYGIMGMGAVCHTLNPRLFSEQLVYIINHAEDKVIFTDLTFLPILAAIRDQIPTVAHIIVFTDDAHMTADLPGAHAYESLLSQVSEDAVWGGFDENSPAGLCYTSGTTGNPKGVLYSHRSNFLHTLVTMGADVLGIGALDTVLPVVPMFHANAWGVAFSAPAVGAKLVMPGAKLDGASIHELLESEQVTFSAAVPTVWQMLLTHLRDTNGTLSSLKRVVIGGSAVPEAIVRAFRDDYGVAVTHAWGMTETSPLGTQATPNHKIAAMSDEDQLRFQLKQGRPPLAIDLRLTNDAGEDLPRDGHTFGKLLVKGPFVVGEYFKGDGGNILDDQGFFDTGDVATLDEHGFMQITDRAKDVIKSGGEWISTIEIENIAAGHPKAELAAVIGMAHPKWDERPLLLVKLRPGQEATKEEFLAFLEGKIAKWWMPDDVVFVDDIPLGATGKIDKKLIRTRMADYVLPTAVVAAASTIALAAPPEPKIYAPEPQAPFEPEVHAPVASEPEGDHTGWSPAAKPTQEESYSGLTVVTPTLGDAPAAEAQAEAILPFQGEPAPEAHAPLSLAPPTAADEPFAAPLARRRAKPRKGDGFAGFYLNLATLLALAPALMVGAGMLGTRYGLMDWKTGLGVIALEWAPKVALIAVAAGLLGVIIALFAGFGRFWARALMVLILCGATFGAYIWARQEQVTNPPINDVSTDWTLPLTFSQKMMRERGPEAIMVEADPMRPLDSAAYAGRRIADINAETCADARPLILASAPGQAYARAKAAVEQAGLSLVTDDPASGRIEATGRSTAFGFKNDVVVRVLPAPQGSRIDVRAISRVPVADFGANCARVTELIGAMRS